MNDRSIQVLEQYELDVEKTRKGRGAILAETREGTFRLSEYRGSVNRLIYEEELTSYIAEKGIEVNGLVRNMENSLFSLDSSGVKYILTKHFNGSECDVRNKNDLYEGVRKLAELHNITSGLKFDNLDYVPVLGNHLEELKRHNTELKRIRNYMRLKTRKSAFEYETLEHFEEFYSQALEAVDKLAENKYGEENKMAVERGDICHGNYNYHNLVHVDNGMAVINFEHSGQGLLIRDFYFFLRKIMEKYDWNQGMGEEMIENYDKIRSISEPEKQILRNLLMYPEKFWKILNHYYNKNKAYLSDQMKDKMKRVYQQQKSKTRFVYSRIWQ